MKKFLILLTFLLTTLNCISQTDTKINDSLICLPKKYLILTAQDLEKGDLCQEELNLTKNNVELYKSQISLKDSIISTFGEKEQLYKNSIDNYNSIVVLKDTQIKDLNKDIKRLKFKNFVITIGIIAIPVAFLLIK